MAKRKRLSPAALTSPGEGPAPETKALNGWVGSRSRVPIADVSGAAAAQAALEEVSEELRSAKAQGRMIARLPLSAVDPTYLVRDRIVVDPEEMEVLTNSLKARGQQTPIEVVDMGQERYGLISGWRRLMALRDLQAQEPDGPFGFVLALIRTPQDASEAYCAMVEENEVRADLSFYERANMAREAVAKGIYSDLKDAVQILYAAARAPKRSKILAFSRVVEHLGDVLRFPTMIPEKLGLALAKALDADPDARRSFREALRKADATTKEGERTVLERVLKRSSPAPSQVRASEEQITKGLTLQAKPGSARLSGAFVDDTFLSDLRQWLQQRASSS